MFVYTNRGRKKLHRIHSVDMWMQCHTAVRCLFNNNNSSNGGTFEHCKNRLMGGQKAANGVEWNVCFQWHNTVGRRNRCHRHPHCCLLACRSSSTTATGKPVLDFSLLPSVNIHCSSQTDEPFGSVVNRKNCLMISRQLNTWCEHSVCVSVCWVKQFQFFCNLCQFAREKIKTIFLFARNGNLITKIVCIFWHCSVISVKVILLNFSRKWPEWKRERNRRNCSEKNETIKKRLPI